MKTLASELSAKVRTEREIVMDLMTPSELEVWRQIAAGVPRKVLAAQRSTSVKTVDSQLVSIRAKLGIHGVADLVRAAVRYGVITVEVVA